MQIRPFWPQGAPPWWRTHQCLQPGSEPTRVWVFAVSQMHGSANWHLRLVRMVQGYVCGTISRCFNISESALEVQQLFVLRLPGPVVSPSVYVFTCSR